MARLVPCSLALAATLAACSRGQEGPSEPSPEERAALARLEEAKQEALAEVDRMRKQALSEIEQARSRAVGAGSGAAAPAEAAPGAAGGAAPPAGSAAPQPGSLTGRVLTSAGERLSLQTPDGNQYDLNVSDEVQVFRGGRPVERRQVREGTQVRASYRPVGNDFLVDRIDVIEGGGAAPPAAGAPPETPEAPAAPGGRSFPPQREGDEE
jgi:hypothetical protein